MNDDERRNHDMRERHAKHIRDKQQKETEAADETRKRGVKNLKQKPSGNGAEHA